MDPKRVRLIGLGFALLLFFWMVKLCFDFVDLLVDDGTSLFGEVDLRTLESRMSQLKPAAFKFPNSTIHLGLFLGAIVIVVLVLWGYGLWVALRRGGAEALDE
jgi:hypothetical protein